MLKNVLEIERLHDQQIKPTAEAPAGTFAMIKSFGMMAFAVGYTDALSKGLEAVKDPILANSIMGGLLQKTVSQSLLGENHEIKNDEFIQNLIESYPHLAAIVTDDLVNLAVLGGLSYVQGIDPKTIPWAGAVPNMVPVFYNPLIEARQQMHMVGETLTITKSTVWQHLHSGAYYQILGGTNQNSKDHETFPPTVIYIDADKNTWSRPLEQFLQKFEFRYAMAVPQKHHKGILE